MINQSGSSSIAFVESKGGESAQEKALQPRDTTNSEHSLKFQHDGVSDGENEPDTTTSVSIQVESENPQSANSRNPRASNPPAGGDSVTPSQEDIHFDTVEEPAPSSVQSVRFQVEDSRTASRTGSKVNRGVLQAATEGESNVEFHEETPKAATPQQLPISALEKTRRPAAAPAPPQEPQQQHEAEDVAVTVESDEEAAAQPATQAKPRGASADASAVNIAPTVVKPLEMPEVEAEAEHSIYPPPRHLPARAATAARTPRANGAAPQTPRNRSPNNSYRPQHTQSEVASPIPAAAPVGGVPPLAPADEKTQADRAVAAAAPSKPQPFARNATGTSDFSSVADPEGPEDAAAAVAAVATPASPNIVVTTHVRTFKNSEWPAVVETSRDTIERTVSNETAAAVGVEAQFVRVTSIEANDEGMTCEISIGHAPSQTTEQLGAAIRDYPYENTIQLLSFAAGHAEQPQQPQQHHQDEEEGSEDGSKAAPPLKYSFAEKVGEGLITIDYCVFPMGSYRHLELSFDGPMSDITIKFVKQCIAEYLGVHESQLVASVNDEEVAEEATGASLGLGATTPLQVHCTIPPQKEDTEDLAELHHAQEPVEEEKKDRPRRYVVPDDLPEKCSFVPHPPAADETPAKKKKKASHKKPAAQAKQQQKQQQAAKKEEEEPKAEKKQAAKKNAAAPAKKKPAAAANKKAKEQKPEAADGKKEKKSTKKTATVEASPAAPAKDGTTKKKSASQRHNAASGNSAVPNYAKPTQKAAAASAAAKKEEESGPSGQKRKSKRSLPRMLTTPRVYRAHSPRPGAENLEEGETMATYLSASRSPSREGTVARSSRAAPVEPQSMSRRSASVPPPSATKSPSRGAAPLIMTRRSSADSRSFSVSVPLSQSVGAVPPQHTVRGVPSVALRPRPVINSPQKQSAHPYAHNAVEHQAETHSASIRSHSPLQTARDGDNDAALLKFEVEEEVVVVVAVAEPEEPVEAHVYRQEDAVVYAEVPEPRGVMAAAESDDDESSEVEFQEEEVDTTAAPVAAAPGEEMEYDYSGEPEQQQQQQQEDEEDPVPAAAPNPFV